ncbi:hypothetical protein Tco_0190788 [Tanacetum coccineum]
MSDSDEPRVTHTEISSPYKDLSDIGSPRADDHEFPDAPPSPEDPEEDPIDYSADGGDDGDADMDIDEEDEDDEMEDEEAEEEHSAPAYPVVVALPATAPSAEETEPFETDESAATPPPHPAYRMTARITIPEPLPVPAWSDSEVARLLAISSPPASPLSPWSSSPPQIPIPLSPPSPVLPAPPPSPIRSLGYRAATIRMRAEAAATSHSLPLPPPFILSPTRPDAPPPLPTSAPTSFPPLSLPTDSHREGRPEVNLPPRMGLGLALGPGYEVGESSAAAAARPAGGFRADYGFVATMDRQVRRDPERYVGYGITDSWDEIVETLQGAPVSTDTELGAHMREFESLVRRDTDEIYQHSIHVSSWRTEAGCQRGLGTSDGCERSWLMEGLYLYRTQCMRRTWQDRRVPISDLKEARAILSQTLTAVQITTRDHSTPGLVTNPCRSIQPYRDGDDIARGRATRTTRATTTPAPTATTTTNVTNAQLQAMINQGVNAALAARDSTRNGTHDSHSSGTLHGI